MSPVRLLTICAALATSALIATSAFAYGFGKPEEWQLGYQVPVTDIAERVQSLSFGLHWLAAIITIFVTGLLAYTCWRFSAKRNPTAARFTHNTAIEVIWTVVPVLILVGMAYPSIKLLYFQETVPPADLTVKAIGNQWRWEYVYDINEEPVYVDSGMAGYGYSNYEAMVAGVTETMTDEEASPEEIAAAIPARDTWKLKATAAMVVPVDSIVRVQVTAADVLHAWTVPAFGVKVDAVPGRLNEVWFKAEQVGTFYGQCSELCGKDHSYMPIEVKVVPKEEFQAELDSIYDEWASRDVPTDIMVASAPKITE